jgi:hypothetical protein
MLGAPEARFHLTVTPPVRTTTYARAAAPLAARPPIGLATTGALRRRGAAAAPGPYVVVRTRQCAARCRRGRRVDVASIADAFVGRDPTGVTTRARGVLSSELRRPVVAASTPRSRSVPPSVAPRLQTFIANNSLPCSVAGPAGRRAGAAPAAGAPILVVGTTRDPATPLVQARALSRA